jgi:ABC-type Na+ transport system ATPase subunit NatA
MDVITSCNIFQDVALYSVLSIRETFQYYGRLYGMTFSEIRRRTTELSKLLDLPSEDTIVDQLRYLTFKLY